MAYSKELIAEKKDTKKSLKWGRGGFSLTSDVWCDLIYTAVYIKWKQNEHLPLNLPVETMHATRFSGFISLFILRRII
jgi:hypothetical protein